MWIHQSNLHQTNWDVNQQETDNQYSCRLVINCKLFNKHTLTIVFLSYLNNSLGLSCYVLKVFITKTTQPYQSFKVSLPKLVRNNTTVYLLNSIYYILKKYIVIWTIVIFLNDQWIKGVNITVQDLLRRDARIQYLYFNISEMKLSITSLYIISDAPKYDIIWIENSDVIDSFVSEILKYKYWILASWRKRSWTVRFTPIRLIFTEAGCHLN